MLPSARSDDPDKFKGEDGDEAINHRDCPHCKLWFNLDEAKPAGLKMVRCPYCDWKIQIV